MRARLVACAAGLALLGAPAAARATCEAWPGEPDPLPTNTSSDPALARWAQLRSLELRAMAVRSAPDPITADRLLRHADCLAPLQDPPPEAPVPRARLSVRVHRPTLGIVGRGAPVREAATLSDALAQLGEPLPVARRAAPPPPLPKVVEPPPAPPREVAAAASQSAAPAGTEETPRTAPPAREDAARTAPPAREDAARTAPPAREDALPQVSARPPAAAPADRPPRAPAPDPPVAPPPAEPRERTVAAVARPAPEPVAPAPPAPAVSAPPSAETAGRLAEAEASLAGARFEETLVWAREGRAALADREDPAARRAQAQLEVLGGAAALALGQDEEAAGHFRRARALDPDIALDPARHSPKVIRAFSAAEPSE